MGQSRGNMPKGFTVRKVRASQSRITDNVRPGQPAGKCNRNKPPRLFLSEQKICSLRRKAYERTSSLKN